MENWDPEAGRRALESVHAGPFEIRTGDRVRLRPCGRADILDLALAGMTATVEAVAAGLLSFLGHSPTFAVREFAGAVEFPDDLIASLRLDLTVGAGGLA